MNNDGSLLNAAKVWREIAEYGALEPVKPYEQALYEALRETKDPSAYGVSDWAWGYVASAGNEAQEAMRLVYRFWLTPSEAGQLRDLAPIMVEIPA